MRKDEDFIACRYIAKWLNIFSSSSQLFIFTSNHVSLKFPLSQLLCICYFITFEEEGLSVRVCASFSRKYQFPGGFRDWTPISLAREPTALIYSLQASATSLASRMLFAARRKEKEQRVREKSLVARVCYGNFTSNRVTATPKHFCPRALYFCAC